MKATTLITIQFISLMVIIGSADGVLKEALASLLFFLAFAASSIYISRNNKKIIRDTNRYFENRA